MDQYLERLVCIVTLLCIQPNQALLRSPWGAWSSCSSSCNGNQDRTRTCNASPGESCDGLTTESRSCSDDNCVTLPVILNIVLGLLVLLFLIVVIYLLIKRRNILKENEEAGFNINAVEYHYDRSLRSSSIGSRGAASSVASSRATIPTIAPYLPDLEEEEHSALEYFNRGNDDNDSLGKVTLSDSNHEVALPFEFQAVEGGMTSENFPPANIPQITVTSLDDDKNDGDSIVSAELF